MTEPKKSQKLQIALTDAINDWMKEKSMNVGEVAGMLGTTPNRAMAAILGREWDPSLREIARIEVAVGEDILAIPRKSD